MQVRSGDKSVKNLSVKQPQADFFLSPCQKQLKKFTKRAIIVLQTHSINSLGGIAAGALCFVSFFNLQEHYTASKVSCQRFLLTLLTFVRMHEKGVAFMSTFYDNYIKLCASCGKNPTTVSKEIGLSNAAASGWKNGKNPSAITKQRLADYFGVSVSELTGEEQKEKPAPGGSELDARFDALLSQMTDADRADLLEYMEFKVAKRKENPNG
nr:MAG TPA: helix-turn-helix domain protein [Caudoviricetes sp.]